MLRRSKANLSAAKHWINMQRYEQFGSRFSRCDRFLLYRGSRKIRRGSEEISMLQLTCPRYTPLSPCK